jgi:hypothetical protein
VELNERYELVRVIDEFYLDGQPDTFNEPYDVFVTANGDIYVADTSNQRALHLDKELNAVKVITKPQDALMDTLAEFLPTKLIVDEANRVYLIARNVNRGVMEFDSTGAFTGYIGANRVNFSVVDMIWKTISTRAQRERMVQFVPTEYSNITLDRKGFMYTTCQNITEDDLVNVANSSATSTDWLAVIFGIGQSSNVEPIRRLNAMGTDILIRNGWVTPLGDLDWDEAGGVSGPSRFVDVAVNEQDTYFALDRNRGRVFGYDFQGNLLFVFGGIGSRTGYFRNPSAIEHRDDGTLLVLDSQTHGLTVFVPTEYGALIHAALAEYVKGNYQESAELWSRVLMYNVNYDLAYIGLGRALLRQERYAEAMEYFKLKNDRLNYSKAFQQYRKIWVEDHIVLIVGGIIALIVLSTAWKQVKRFRRKGAGDATFG